MRFDPPLLRGILQRRYNRFLAEVTLDDGRSVTVHCPNSGSMMGLSDPGLTVWVMPTGGPKRKLAYGWRLVALPDGHFAGIDTQIPNRVVAEALADRAIPAFAGYGTIRREVPYGTRSRVDFVLEAPGLPKVYLEVKNVHLRRTGTLAEFPDCVTARGARHLAELAGMAAQGVRAVMLYVVQRTDCDAVALAADIDPAYAQAAAAARRAGVEVIAHGCAISTDGVRLRPAPLPVMA